MKKLVIKYLYDLRCEGCGAIHLPVSEYNSLCPYCMANWISLQLRKRRERMIGKIMNWQKSSREKMMKELARKLYEFKT